MVDCVASGNGFVGSPPGHGIHISGVNELVMSIFRSTITNNNGIDSENDGASAVRIGQSLTDGWLGSFLSYGDNYTFATFTQPTVGKK